MSNFEELKKDVEKIAENRYLSFVILVEENSDLYLASDYEEWIDQQALPWLIAYKEQGVINDQERAILGSIFWCSWANLLEYIKIYQPTKKGNKKETIWRRIRNAIQCLRS